MGVVPQTFPPRVLGGPPIGNRLLSRSLVSSNVGRSSFGDTIPRRDRVGPDESKTRDVQGRAAVGLVRSSFVQLVSLLLMVLVQPDEGSTNFSTTILHNHYRC